jgi:hypothetical protein
MAQMRYFAPRNRQASLLRQRKYQLVRRFGLPPDVLGGCLALTHRRCGKPTCHCVKGPGHPMWTLTYSSEGKKRAEGLPASLAAELAPLVEQGRELREAVMEVLAINLQLLRLWRQEQRQRPVRRRPPKRRV